MNAKLSPPLPLSFHVESDTITELAAFLETQARQGSARILLAEKTSEWQRLTRAMGLILGSNTGARTEEA